MFPLFVYDPDDPRISAFRAVRERDLVGREGQFIAEGEVVLRMLIRSTRHKPKAVLIDGKRIEKLAALLSELPYDVPVYAGTQAVLDAIAGFHLHRGILAIAERGLQPTTVELLSTLSDNALVVVAIGIANHDNIGGIFRNAAAFGADAVLLDPESCDPFYRKAIRVSVGAVLSVPSARFLSNDELFEALGQGSFTPFALSPSGNLTLTELKPPARSAVLMGAEGPGLPAEVLARSTTVRISMAEGFDSLNVGTACGIVLHHLRSRPNC
ncbi:TrmH family RNA methyltransferase [Flaviflagellibacter deserti]|jgi:tRNA G18 (ribose-2'-O)-methylase SpoU|uniref:TrmH family RNA methyltransferase n=1 Tax=Flaviflagellibacter deserti TaxID=2267266 RepID=A0ABV9Z301_9HYPH